MSEQTMVERVACAIYCEEDLSGLGEVTANIMRDRARAAIAAMRVPSEAMVDEGIWALPAHSECVDVVEVYTAMIDAALSEVTI